MFCKERFLKIYKRESEGVAFTPYRVCPIGAHVDHQNGKITGFAIDKGIYIAYSSKQNGVIELSSMQFDKRAQWHVNSVPNEKQEDWADHLRGATIALGARYNLRVGICAVIEGELPIGGLSSSAAIIITFLSVLCKVNGIKITEKELIEISREAENIYVGVSCGKLDQSCEVYCKKDHLLYMDLSNDKVELIKKPSNMKPFKIAIFFSGLERSLASSDYNVRVDECTSAAYALLAFEGAKYGKFKDTYLHDVPKEIFEKHKDKLPKKWRMRAEHYYAEVDRVERGAKAFSKGDIAEYGRLCTESGYSSIHVWETGSKQLKSLYEIIIKVDGVYGGRFSGAGFKGCCMAIIDPEKQEQIVKEVTEKYLQEFPELKDKFSAYVCDTADGVKL